MESIGVSKSTRNTIIRIESLTSAKRSSGTPSFLRIQ